MKEIDEYNTDNFLNIIFDDTEENNEITLECFSTKYTQLLNLLQEQEDKINNQSEIQIEKSNSKGGTSINDLFHDIVFEDSITTKAKPSSVVRPTNTFNFETKDKLHFDDSFIEIKENFLDIDFSPQNKYINYMQNVNINVNNYGQINLAGVNKLKILNSNNKIKEKLKEVYSCLNSSKEDFTISNRKTRNDHFSDFYKSIRTENKLTSLKNISDRILNKTKRINEVEIEINKQKTLNSKNRFLDLKKMLKYPTVDVSKKNSMFQLEEQLSNLQLKTKFNTKNLSNLNTKFSNVKDLKLNIMRNKSLKESNIQAKSPNTRINELMNKLIKGDANNNIINLDLLSPENDDIEVEDVKDNL
jgi:hypothetical protein